MRWAAIDCYFGEIGQFGLQYCHFRAGPIDGPAKFERKVVFKIIDRISNSSPNAFVNEDAIGATSTSAWVIDGATGVSDRPPIGGWNDGCGMAGRTVER